MCKYCEGGVAIVDGKYLGLTIVKTTGKNNAYIWGYDKSGWDISSVFQMKYCPMCGEKINEN